MFIRSFVSLTLALGVCACQKHQATPQKKTLSINFQEGDPPSLNPQVGVGHIRSVSLSKLLFEGLTRLGPCGAELTGAESMTLSDDHLTYTFTLRPQVWSDGTPVTSAHYLAAWQEAIRPGSDSPFADLFYPIQHAQEIKKGELPLSAFGVSAPDEQTLVVHLNHPLPSFPGLLANPLFSPLKVATGEPEVFNGPFTLVAWEKGKEIVLAKNPRFWNADQVHLDGMLITLVPDPMTGLQLFEKGESDWVGSPISILPPDVVPHYEAKQMLKEKPSFLVYCIHLNLKDPILRSQPFRKALSLALDREQINRHILIGTPHSSPLPTALSTTQEVAPYAPQEAATLFSKALTNLNLTRDDLPTLTFRYFDHPRMKALAQYVQESWKKNLGITVQLECTDWNTFSSLLHSGQFQIAGCNEMPYYPDPLDILDRYQVGHASNTSSWSNPAYECKVSLARQALDFSARTRYLAEAEALLLDQVPIIPLSNGIQAYVHTPGLKGYHFDIAGFLDLSYSYFE